MKHKVAELLGLPNITPEELKHEKFGPKINEIYRKLSREKSQTDGYYLIIWDYLQSLSRDSESSLRTFTGLNEDDIQLILKQNISKFVTFKMSPGAYTFRDLSEVLSRGFKNEVEIRWDVRHNYQHDEVVSIIIDSNNVSLITRLRLWHQIKVLRFDKELFFNTVLGFTPYWDYKSYCNEYYSEKNRNLRVIDKIHLKHDVNESSAVKSIREPLLYTFILDKPSGYKVFCKPGTIQNKRKNRSVLKTITVFKRL